MKKLSNVNVFCPICGCEFGKFKKIIFDSAVDFDDFTVDQKFSKDAVIRGGSIFCPLCAYQFNMNAMQFVIVSAMYPDMYEKFRTRIKKELAGIKQKTLKEQA